MPAVKKPTKRKTITRPAGSNYFAPPPSSNDQQPTAPVAEFKEQETEFEKSIGISVASLKAKFDKESINYDEKTKKLVELLTARVKTGRDFGLSNYRVYAAIDEAWRAPFQQITPTLIQKITSKTYTKFSEVEQDLAAWGLTDENLYGYGKNEHGEQVKFLKEKTFWKVFVPLVKAYTMIRIAKLFSDRDNTPWMKYEPEENTDEGMVLGQILTKLTSKMVHQYGYKAVYKQVLTNTLKYSFSLMFPLEAWNSEEVADTDGDGRHAIREGLRYAIPHPTRVGYDQSHRLSTFNTDTGCEWASHWRLLKASDVFNHPLFWKKNQIGACSQNWFDNAISGNYFRDIFPCTMKLLTYPTASQSGQRDDTVAALYYSANDADRAVFVTDMFCKLNPKEWGLGDYAHPVWFRFVMANDDTVCYAEPLAYCPILYCGFDPDENLDSNSSMALEILPWQDMCSNVLSQWLCSVRQNLKSIVPYDEDQVDPSTINKLNSTSNDVETITFMPFSARRARMGQQDPSKMFNLIQLPHHDVTQFVITLDRIIQLMERLLNMSASESGSAGVHIQTAEEIKVISQNTSIRVSYTGSFVDEFFDGWKRQLIAASRAYMDDEFITEVSLVRPEHKAILKELGFELIKESGERVVKLKGKRSKVVLETWISSREGQDRVNNPQVAQVMLQALQAAAKMGLLQALGAEQIVEIFNRASILAGAPKDFKLIIPKTTSQGAVPGGETSAPASSPNSLEVLMQAIQKQVTEMIGSSNAALVEQMQKAIANVVEAIKSVKAEAASNTQVNDAQQEQLKQLTDLVLKLDSIIKQASAPPPPPVPGLVATEAPPAGPMIPTVPPEMMPA